MAAVAEVKATDSSVGAVVKRPELGPVPHCDNCHCYVTLSLTHTHASDGKIRSCANYWLAHAAFICMFGLGVFAQFHTRGISTAEVSVSHSCSGQ